HRPTQVLMLTARGRVEDRVEGLDRGADDYLVKPFSFAGLAARLRALDRRPKPSATELRTEDLALDLLRRTASVRGERLDLTPTEFSLLAALLRERGAAISRRALLREVWGYEFDPGTNVVDVHVNRLRRKLEDRGLENVIRTVRGSGYAAAWAAAPLARALRRPDRVDHRYRAAARGLHSRDVLVRLLCGRIARAGRPLVRVLAAGRGSRDRRARARCDRHRRCERTAAVRGCGGS